jgi:hypothetical protein
MGPLYHPAVGAFFAVGFFRRCLLAPDVGIDGVVEVSGDFSDERIIVPLIEPKPLWVLPRCEGTADRNAIEGPFEELFPPSRHRSIIAGIELHLTGAGAEP